MPAVLRARRALDEEERRAIDAAIEQASRRTTADVLVVLKSARIDGDISYGTLTVEEGAQVNGKFTPRAPELKLTLAGGTEAG